MRVLIAFILIGCFPKLSQGQGEQYFVDSSILNGDGLSWATAFSDLNDAIREANPGDTILLASGTYYPTLGTDRNARFDLEDSLIIIGGFVGLGHSPGNPLEIDPLNKSILSGDIGIRGDSLDNSYHILYADGKSGLELGMALSTNFILSIFLYRQSFH